MFFAIVFFGVPLMVWAVIHYGLDGDRNIPEKPRGEWEFEFHESPPSK